MSLRKVIDSTNNLIMPKITLLIKTKALKGKIPPQRATAPDCHSLENLCTGVKNTWMTSHVREGAIQKIPQGMTSAWLRHYHNFHDYRVPRAAWKIKDKIIDNS